MANHPERIYGFVERFYKMLSLLAITIVAIVGTLVTVLKFDVKISDVWTEVKVPLYVTSIVLGVVLVLYVVTVVVLGLKLKDAAQSSSYYKTKSKNLEASVFRLEALAYNDPITGIGNSHALERELAKAEEGLSLERCLILLDLQNFGEINKKYNLSKGDEYLRRFAEKVTTGTRRNEFLFKKRPVKTHSGKGKDTGAREDEAKAFRRNSGGDEFFVLLQGTVVDGLGYLTRLQKRAGEFEQMSVDLLGGHHSFGFHAGLVAVGKGEHYESVDKRVSTCLGLAQESGWDLRVYWNSGDLTDLDRIPAHQRMVDEARKTFRKMA